MRELMQGWGGVAVIFLISIVLIVVGLKMWAKVRDLADSDSRE